MIFTKKIRVQQLQNKVFFITIPQQIAKNMQINKGDYVDIEYNKETPKEYKVFMKK